MSNFRIQDPHMTHQREAKDASAMHMQASCEINATGEARPATNGCFVAGTLVHTRQGLVPIEKIQVGDWVLSQPEEQGELAYKPVVKAFSFDDKEIFLVRFHKVGGAMDESMTIESVAVTGNHPFWVEGQGWTRADSLNFGDRLELLDGSHVSLVCASRAFLTAEDGVGWVVGGWGIEMNDGSGNRVDCRNGSISVDFDGSFNFEALEDPDQSALKARVFNFAVEDFHTYYIGAMGVWVHNTNCDGMGPGA